MAKKTGFSCSRCSTIWQKKGKTNCWSGDPDSKPSKPGYCPTHDHMDAIQESFDLYKGDSEDAKMARVAARVEGLCYQPISGSETVNARWTRVEDTIAFAKLMEYRKMGIATCIGLLEETILVVINIADNAPVPAQPFGISKSVLMISSVLKICTDRIV